MNQSGAPNDRQALRNCQRLAESELHRAGAAIHGSHGSLAFHRIPRPDGWLNTVLSLLSLVRLADSTSISLRSAPQCRPWAGATMFAISLWQGSSRLTRPLFRWSMRRQWFFCVNRRLGRSLEAIADLVPGDAFHLCRRQSLPCESRGTCAPYYGTDRYSMRFPAGLLPPASGE